MSVLRTNPFRNDVAESPARSAFVRAVGHVSPRTRTRRVPVDISQGARNTSSGHRWSISSADNGQDIEARPSSSRPRANSASKSPMGHIADRLMNMRDSITSLPTESVWTARTNYAWDIRLLFKRRITNLYVSFSCLKSYVEVNYSGFRKILKKYVPSVFASTIS